MCRFDILPSESSRSKLGTSKRLENLGDGEKRGTYATFARFVREPDVSRTKSVEAPVDE